MKLIVGLGNPGKEYEHTRHNAGFLMLDQIAETHGWTSFLYQKKFDADIAQGNWKKRQCMAIKPQTFMNKSGSSVQHVMNFYQIPAEQTLIIHDDIDLPFGTIKLKFNGSDGGQNGLKDIFAKCGTQRFRRLKIGIGRPEHPGHDIVDRVLSRFTTEELAALQKSEKEIDLKIDQCFRDMGAKS